jgi:uncharacterized protein YceH (UPF0502 family)
MLQLTPDECRVLGVLVEKAQTTPAQYPLTLNGLVLGCNQKNNREPVTALSEDEVLTALDGLRAKGLVREAMLSGSRVAKYRHVARETLSFSTPELVIVAELLMRGPQSVGELRGRASRMHPLESLEAVQAVVDGLAARAEPVVVRVPPGPGSRAVRYAQRLCPDLHPLDEASHEAGEAEGESAGSAAVERISRLEEQVAALRRAIRDLAESAGVPDPMG